MPAGTIEHGAHFTFIDLAGAEHHGFRTLRAAQDAAEDLAEAVPHHQTRPGAVEAIPRRVEQSR